MQQIIIDDKQILRTILYYPLTTGRNIPEILRIIEALQTSDKDNIVTPANWFPGMPVILPYPKTYKQLKNTVSKCNNDNSSCMDWYLCFVPDKSHKHIKSDTNIKTATSKTTTAHTATNIANKILSFKILFQSPLIIF